MPEAAKRKQSLYFPDDTLEEIRETAVRLDRSLSWVMQKAWSIAREQIHRIPSVDEPTARRVGSGGA